MGNQLKQYYGNFKRNIDDLDTMSLDDVYNHLKVYEPEVQKKAGLNLQNMEFISHKHIIGKSEVPLFKEFPSDSTIDDDDIEEMDIKWNLALLSMRADRSFSLENEDHQRSQRQEGKRRELQEGLSYVVEEDEASKNHALVVNEVVPTKFALMAKSNSSSDNEVYDDSFCSKSCRKTTENLNTKIIKLNEELSDCETDLYNYKRGLSQVEARLVEFKENEIKLCEKIRILERDIELKDNKIKYLRNELEEKGVGFDEYYVAPPPPIQVYSPPKQDLSWIGLHEFVNDTATDYTRPTPSINVSKGVSSELEGYNTSVFDQAGSSSNVMSKPMIKFVKGTGCSNVIKVNNTKSVRKPTMKYAEMAGTLHKVLELGGTKGIGTTKNPNN
ncbi:hypothetical protein Tco_1301608 [Tanacetum coccineum]